MVYKLCRRDMEANKVGSKISATLNRRQALKGAMADARLSAETLAAAAGRSLRYLVPDAVARYIADHALYRRIPAS